LDYILAVLRLLFALLAAMSLKAEWLIICGVAVAMTVINIAGYIKCAKGARKQISSLATSYLTTQMINQTFSDNA